MTIVKWSANSVLGTSLRCAVLPRGFIRKPKLFHKDRQKSTGVRSQKQCEAEVKTRLVSELPKVKVDQTGDSVNPLQPLYGFSPVRTAKKTRTKAKIDDILTQSLSETAKTCDHDNEAAYRAAVEAGAIPDSPLAKEVFLNWKRYPGCIVLTRVGKFYESYFEPAVHLASLLSLRLAQKKYTSGLYPFAGFPVPQLDKYLKMLVHDLKKSVVLVEEYPEDPANQLLSVDNNITRRVGRIVTPGTLIDDSWISGDESRYLLAIASAPIDRPGHVASLEAQMPVVSMSLAYTDVSTGEFFIKLAKLSDLEDELARIAPKEIIVEPNFKCLWSSAPTSGIAQSAPIEAIRLLLESTGAHITFDDPSNVEASTIGPLAEAPSSAEMEGRAVAILRRHLAYTLRDNTPDLANPDRQRMTGHMQIDAATLHALEIRLALRASGADVSEASDSALDGSMSASLSSRGTLLSVLRRTVTAAGSRLLTRTLTSPSTNLEDINARLDLVEEFLANNELRRHLRSLAKQQVDVMRLMQRFKARRGDGRDLAEVGRWLRGIENIVSQIRNHCENSRQQVAGVLQGLAESFRPSIALASTIENAVDEAILTQSSLSETDSDEAADEQESLVGPEGDAVPMELSQKAAVVETKMEMRERQRQQKDNFWWIKPSYSPQMGDAHRRLDILLKDREHLQDKLRRRYNVPSLVLTKGFRYGYYASISKKVEADSLEKSTKFTLATSTKSNRAFIYNSWTTLGFRIEDAILAIQAVQHQAFEGLRQAVVAEEANVKRTSDILSELDVVLGFAQAAQELKLTRPRLDDSADLEIVNGRHPAVEAGLLAASRTFTPNSIHMHPPESQLHVITGPNQGGKSTILRQTALITILAQAGCFVPAADARIGIVDRVFSRIGARDDLFRDRSTFMLEMVETAAILRQATNRSLVIMDEIGRGTTLQAGLSIAYATLDHILRKNGCRTLFATHYHELGDMLGYAGEGSVSAIEGVEFWCTDVEEDGDSFSYSYRLQPGLNHQSHAIKAAKLAGMPSEFLEVAERTLAQLQEAERLSSNQNCTIT